MEMAMKVAPSGLPTWRSRTCGELTSAGSEVAIVVFRRKSCVTAMPMLAKEREVRSQARKVRSAVRGSVSWFVPYRSNCEVGSPGKAYMANLWAHLMQLRQLERLTQSEQLTRLEQLIQSSNWSNWSNWHNWDGREVQYLV